jgi:hypothetical protein
MLSAPDDALDTIYAGFDFVGWSFPDYSQSNAEKFICFFAPLGYLTRHL